MKCQLYFGMVMKLLVSSAQLVIHEDYCVKQKPSNRFQNKQLKCNIESNTIINLSDASIVSLKLFNLPN